MKLQLIAVLLLPSLLLATGSVHHNTYNGAPGPQGPVGPQGQAGSPGAPGVMGLPGLNGQDTIVSERDHLNAYLGAGVRLYDARYWQATTYASQDVWHGGTMVGGLITFKVGKSWEEREIDRLRTQLQAILGAKNETAIPNTVIKSTIRGSK